MDYILFAGQYAVGGAGDLIAAASSFVYYIIRMKKLFFFPFSSSIEGTNLMEMVIELSRRRMFITGGGLLSGNKSE